MNIIKKMKVKTILSKSMLKELDYSLNPYLGCNFICNYCYAPNFTPNLEVSKNWGHVIMVKENLVEVLRKEVKVERRGVVGISTITDPYQPVEGEYKLTRKSIKILTNHGFRISIQTKSPLILRDLNILLENRKLVDVGISITTLDKDKAKFLEPLAPLPQSRIKVLRKISDSGIETWLYLGPIIRGINDERSEIRDIIDSISDLQIKVIFDKYNHYKNLKFREGGNYWWKEIKDYILNLCKERKMECLEESEDWVYEKLKRNAKLF
jgi:DNA repair photolyase